MQAEKMKPQEQVTLEPYERDHAVVVGVYRAPPKKKEQSIRGDVEARKHFFGQDSPFSEENQFVNSSIQLFTQNTVLLFIAYKMKYIHVFLIMIGAIMCLTNLLQCVKLLNRVGAYILK